MASSLTRCVVNSRAPEGPEGAAKTGSTAKAGSPANEQPGSVSKEQAGPASNDQPGSASKEQAGYVKEETKENATGPAV